MCNVSDVGISCCFKVLVFYCSAKRVMYLVAFPYVSFFSVLRLKSIQIGNWRQWLPCRILKAQVLLEDTDSLYHFSLTLSLLRAPFLTCFLLSSLQCNNDYVPVCGSNNKNYQNECFLRRDACKQQSEVLIVSEGDCPAGMYIYLMVPTHKHKHKPIHAWIWMQRSSDTSTLNTCASSRVWI